MFPGAFTREVLASISGTGQFKIIEFLKRLQSDLPCNSRNAFARFREVKMFKKRRSYYTRTHPSTLPLPCSRLHEVVKWSE